MSGAFAPRGDVDGRGSAAVVLGSRFGVLTCEDMADGGKTRFARRKVKNAGPWSAPGSCNSQTDSRYARARQGLKLDRKILGQCYGDPSDEQNSILLNSKTQKGKTEDAIPQVDFVDEQPPKAVR